MPVDANTYGTQDGVELLIGVIVSGRDFTASTIPTDASVDAALDSIADILNAELLASDYTIPVASGTNPEAHGMLFRANNAGAAADLLNTIPNTSWSDPEMGPKAGGDRKSMYENMLTRILSMIQSKRFPADKSRGSLAPFFVGSRTDRDTGEVKNPLFTRKKFDNPTSRVLQE